MNVEEDAARRGCAVFSFLSSFPFRVSKGHDLKGTNLDFILEDQRESTCAPASWLSS